MRRTETELGLNVGNKVEGRKWSNPPSYKLNGLSDEVGVGDDEKSAVKKT